MKCMLETARISKHCCTATSRYEARDLIIPPLRIQSAPTVAAASRMNIPIEIRGDRHIANAKTIMSATAVEMHVIIARNMPLTTPVSQYSNMPVLHIIVACIAIVMLPTSVAILRADGRIEQHSITSHIKSTAAVGVD